MDTIRLTGLKLETVIGAHDWERQLRQLVILDLEIAVDTKAAAASDQLSDTLDYAAVARRLSEFVADAQFHLIEALAEACARIVLAEFRAMQVQLTVHKPGAIRGASDVAVRISRAAADYT